MRYTTVADKSLLPPIAGIDMTPLPEAAFQIAIAPPLRGLIYIIFRSCRHMFLLPPIAGIDISFQIFRKLFFTIAPNCGD